MKCPKCKRKMERLEWNDSETRLHLQYICEKCNIFKTKKFEEYEE